MNKHYVLLISVYFLLTGLFSGCRKDIEKPAASSAKAFTAFTIKKENNKTLTEDIPGLINQDTIFLKAVTGKSLTFIPDFSFEGVDITVNKVKQESGKSEQDFSNPVKYTIRAEDGSIKNYTVIFQSAISPCWAAFQLRLACYCSTLSLFGIWLSP